MYLLLDVALQLFQIPLPPIIAMSAQPRTIFQMMVFLATGMVMISASRKYRFKLFNMEFSTLHTL